MIHQIVSIEELRKVPHRAETNRPAEREHEPAASAADTVTPPGEDVSEQAMQRAVARLREVLRNVDPRLRIEIDRNLNRIIVKIVNGQSGEVIRQIPPEELLNLARQFDGVTGLLVEERA